MEDYLERRRQDFGDLMDELAGRPNGKMDRFLTGDASLRDETREARRERGFFFLYILGILLRQQLEQAYARAWDALERAQAAVDQALLYTAETADHLETVIADMETRAIRTADGRMVFEDTHNDWRMADGRHLRAEDAAALAPSAQDRANAPNWESWRDARFATERLQQRRSDLIETSDFLSRSRDQLERRDLDLDEVNALVEEIEAVENDVSRLNLTDAFHHSQGGETDTTPVKRKMTLDGYRPGSS